MRFNSNPDNTVSVRYNAGGSYTHSLWSYDSEFLVFRRNGREYLFAVERKRVSPTREIIILIPKVGRDAKVFAGNGYPFVRHSMAVSNMQAHAFNTVEGHFVHIAPFGSYTSVAVNVGNLETCRARLKCMKEPKASTVEQHFNGVLKNNQHTEFGSLIFMFLMGGQRVNTTEVLGYSVTSNTLSEPASSYRLAHTPVDANGSAPMRSRANDEWCIQERLTNVSSDVPYSDLLDDDLKDFLSLFDALVPVDFDVVAEKQARPTQRRLREEAGPVFSANAFKLKSFQKAEAYPSAKPPRNITTVEAGFKTQYSRYTYAMFDFCQRFSWFAPGKTPLDISTRVLDLSKVGPLSEADYSKFDGSKSPCAVSIELAILNKCFPGDECVKDLFKKQIGARAVTSNGVSYNVGTSRLSGSPDTTILNTLLNAFIAFRALRHYDFMVSGDDIVFCGDADIAKHASEIGYKLEVVSYPRYPGFLGRIYYNLPASAESFYDVKRFIPKMHVCTAPSTVPLHIAVSRKAQGYLQTDPNTPIITNWCNAMLKRYGLQETTKYDDQIDLPYFFNSDTAYPVDEKNDITGHVVEYMGESPTFVDDMKKMLDGPVQRYSTMVPLQPVPGVTIDGVAGPTKILLKKASKKKKILVENIVEALVPVKKNDSPSINITKAKDGGDRNDNFPKPKLRTPGSRPKE
jgi:hypothetical protein